MTMLMMMGNQGLHSCSNYHPPANCFTEGGPYCN